MKQKEKKWFKPAAGIVLSVCILAVIYGIWTKQQESDIVKSQEAQCVMQNLQEEEVEALFISMYPLDSYDADDFLYYRGYRTTFFSKPLESGKNLLKFLKQSLEEQHSLKAVYIGVTQQDKDDGWEEKLLKVVEQNPEIRFHIIIEYPYIEELAQMSQSEQERLFAWYEKMADLFTPDIRCQNKIVFLPQAEMWLTGNPANYLENGQLNKDAARYSMMEMACVDYYALNTANAAQKISVIKEMIAGLDSRKAINSEYTFVFFGDSVIGNYQDSMSIPGVVSGIGQAAAINCGYGGLAASKVSEESYGITDMITAFLEGQYEQFEDDKAIKKGIPQFYEMQSEIKEDKLVFLLSLGINDYMTGYDIDAFVKGMEDAVNMLRQAYPKSEIVLMTPNFIARNEYGTMEINGYTMEALTERIILLSEQLQTKCIDVFHESGFGQKNHETYIADLVHPNALGRYKIGEIVCEHLAQWYPN